MCLTPGMYSSSSNNRYDVGIQLIIPLKWHQFTEFLSLKLHMAAS